MITNDRQQPEQVITVGGLATELPPCTLQRPVLLSLTADPDAGSNGLVTFTNTGSTVCVLDQVGLVPSSAPGFEVISGAVTQRSLMPGERHEVHVHGPDAGSGRSERLRYHLLGQNSDQQFIHLQGPP